MLKIKLVVLAAVGALALAVAPAALANSGAAEDANFALAVSLSCAGDGCASSEAVHAGQAIALGASITSKRSFNLGFVSVSLAGPGGAIYSVSRPVLFLGARTYTLNALIPVLDAYPAGLYTLTVSVNGLSASADITVE